MKSSDRRSLLAGLAATAGLPLLALPVRAAAGERRIAFPAAAVTLRREVERDLGANASLSVVRQWRCEFKRNESGAYVYGEQTGCKVRVPDHLEALGRIEHARKVTGLFPMSLDRRGLIASWGDGEPVGIAAAIQEARRHIGQLQLQGGQETDARTYFAEIGRKAAHFVSSVPRDLFFPEAGMRSEIRSVELPGGQQGTYEVTVDAATRGRDGLLSFSERRIVTRIGDTSRLARERWTLLP